MPVLPLVLALAEPAAAASWDPDLRWQTLRTEHFRITFHGGEERIAAEMAELSEEAFKVLTGEIGSTPRTPIDIVLVDWTDSPNGSATIVPSNTITIFVTQPSGESTLGLYENWSEAIVTHELAHVVHLDTVEGLPKAARYLFGSLISTHQVAPLWTIEGFATLEETRHTTGGRGRSASVDMVKRAAVLEDRFPPLGNLDGFTALPPSGNLRYLFGQDFMQFIADSRGADKWSEWIHRYGASIPLFLPAKRTFGDSFVTLYEEWRAELATRYGAQKAAIEAEGLTPMRMVSDEGIGCGTPSFSPDGSRIVYSCSDPRRGVAIWTADGEGKKAKILLKGKFADDVSWRNDGGAFVYSNAHVDKLYHYVDDVFLFELEGKSVRQLTSGDRARDPAFSPDGTRIVAVADELQTNRMVELTIDQRALPLADPGDSTVFNTPRWSPDGTRLAVSVFRDGQRDIWIYAADGTPLRQLTRDSALDTQPVWSADGKTIYFASDRSGVPNIYAVDLASEHLFRVSNVLTGAWGPSPSPDGRALAFLNFSTLGARVALMDVDRGTWKDLGQLPRLDVSEVALSAPVEPRNLIRSGSEPLPIATAEARTERERAEERKEHLPEIRKARREGMKQARLDCPPAGKDSGRAACLKDARARYSVGGEGEITLLGKLLETSEQAEAAESEARATSRAARQGQAAGEPGDAAESGRRKTDHRVGPYNPVPTLLPPRFWVPGALFTTTGDDYGLYLAAWTGGVDVLRQYGYSGYLTYRTDANFLGGGMSFTLNKFRPVFGWSLSTYVSPYGAIYVDSPLPTHGGGTIPTLEQSGERYWDHRVRTSLAMGYPIDERSSFSLSWRGELREPKDPLPEDPYYGALPTRGFFSSFAAGWSRGKGESYALSISPEKARVLGAGIEYTPWWLGSFTYDENNEPIPFDQLQLTGEWREYRTAPWKPNHVFALKVSGGLSMGSAFRYGSFRLGGTWSENGITVIPQEWRALRGYYTSTRSGETYWLASGEYRFPVWYIDRGVGTIPFFMRHISGAVIVDAGNAWNDPDDAALSNSLCGVGAELRAAAIAFYGVPLYGRVGYSFALTSDGIPIGSIDGLYIEAGTSF